MASPTVALPRTIGPRQRACFRPVMTKSEKVQANGKGTNSTDRSAGWRQTFIVALPDRSATSSPPRYYASPNTGSSLGKATVLAKASCSDRESRLVARFVLRTQKGERIEPILKKSRKCAANLWVCHRYVTGLLSANLTHQLFLGNSFQGPGRPRKAQVWPPLGPSANASAWQCGFDLLQQPKQRCRQFSIVSQCCGPERARRRYCVFPKPIHGTVLSEDPHVVQRRCRLERWSPFGPRK